MFRLPKIPSKHKIAIIFDSPTKDDALTNDFCSGYTGGLFRAMLSQHGLVLDNCFIGTVFDQYVYDVVRKDWPLTIHVDSQPLIIALSDFQPNITILCGRAAFRLFHPSHATIPKPKDGLWNMPIFEYRGSLLLAESNLPTENAKTIITHSVQDLSSDIGLLPLIRFDFSRAVRHSKTRDLVLPKRNIQIYPSVADVIAFLTDISNNYNSVGFDIEGYADNVGITELSFSKSPTDCLVIPLFVEGKHYFSEADEVIVWEYIAKVLEDPKINKICHNGLYELFVSCWSHKIVIRNINDDTMMMHFEVFPEHEKNLGVATSVWTDEPYYKSDRTSSNLSTRLEYNGKDSCCTQEIAQVASSILKPAQKSHYRFNVSLLYPLTYMSLCGVRFDFAAHQRVLQEAEAELTILQEQLSKAVGQPINAKSWRDKNWLLYDFLGYEPYQRYGRTSKEIVILRYFEKDRHPILKLLLQCVFLRTRISDANKLLPTDADNRLRCGYNAVGTVSCRLSSSSSSARFPYFTKSGLLKWDWSGTNMQNVTKDLRVCALADSEDEWFAQLDLSGADGWTVAADLAALGYPAMLDDYLYGLKPAKILVLMLLELEAGRNPAMINRLSREELKKLCKQLDTDSPEISGKYLCMKKVQHGTNYWMKPPTVSETIFKDSEGKIDLPPVEAAKYQSLYSLRYNPEKRVDWMIRTLKEKGGHTSAVGFHRQAYSLRSKSNPEDSMVREFLSWEPQVITTFVCNQALLNLWNDPANRRSDGSLFIKPRIQIHDALCVSFPKRLSDWAVSKLKSYFRNEITIHGIPVSIPFEGGYGPNWKESKQVEFKT